MDTQLIVEYLFDLALKQDVDTRETLSEMDKVLNQAIATARSEALKLAADRADECLLEQGYEKERYGLRSFVRNRILADKQD